jgi:hypothetical protein
VLSISLFAVQVRGKGGSISTALMVAAENEHDEVVKLLVQRGKADIHARNEDGESALHLRCAACHLSTVQLLLVCGASGLFLFVCLLLLFCCVFLTHFLPASSARSLKEFFCILSFYYC